MASLVATVTEHPHTLLLVDDEQEILETLRRTLRREGYRILAAPSGARALEILAEESVDVLISDIDMPHMSGIELIDRVRQHHPHVVRMLLTGAATLESAMDAINAGEVHRYLTKPWSKTELRTTVRQAIERLKELRRAAEAERSVSARERLLCALEREHPGIRKVELDDGVYLLDERRLIRAVLDRGPPAVSETLLELDDPAIPDRTTHKLNDPS